MKHSEEIPFSSFFVLTARLFQGALWVPAYVFYRFFMHLSVKGREHIREAETAARAGRGVLFLPVHISEFDPTIIVAGVHPFSPLFPMLYVSRPRSAYQGQGWRGRYLYGGLFFALWGAFPAIPGHKDYAITLTNHRIMLLKGRSVCIFPSGHVVAPHEVAPARGGAGYLMEATNPLVVPVVIRGIYKPNVQKVFLRRMYAEVAYLAPRDPSEFLDATLPVPERYQHAAHTVLEATRARA